MSKLLFFDIDGTLAMPGKTVSQRTRDAIRAARANGHKAFICTGRSRELVNEDILSIGFDGGIFHAGGRAVIDGETVYENHADSKMLDDVLPSIRERAVFYNYETTGGDYFSRFDTEVLKEVQVEGANTELLRLIEALASPENRPVSDYAGEGIYKVFFFVRKVADYEKIIESFGPGYLPTNFSNMIEDYRLKLFLSDHGYIKKIALTSLRNAGDLKIKEDDEIVMELEGTNKSEILFFSDKANCYKMKAFELPDTKPSEYGGYLPNVLQMEEGEKIIFMHVADDFKGNVLFSFENGKISKIPMSAYETKQNRKKLIHAYSDISPIVCIRYITEDVDMAAFSNLRKAIVFNSSLIPLKTTRSSQGVQVLTSKKGSVMTEVKRVEETDFTDPEYYRVRRLPAIGYYLKEETIEDRQLTLGDL